MCNKLQIRIMPLISTTLLLVLLLPPLMIFPVRQMIFLSQSGKIRKVESNGEKLEKMVFTTAAFSKLNFTRKNLEFVYRGNMYDVQSITKSGNQVIVLALWDAAESNLLTPVHDQGEYDNPASPVTKNIGFIPYFIEGTSIASINCLVPDEIDYLFLPAIYKNPWSLVKYIPPELLSHI